MMEIVMLTIMSHNVVLPMREKEMHLACQKSGLKYENDSKPINAPLRSLTGFFRPFLKPLRYPCSFISMPRKFFNYNSQQVFFSLVGSTGIELRQRQN